MTRKLFVTLLMLSLLGLSLSCGDGDSGSSQISKIAFTYGFLGENRDIYVINADGTNQTRLTNDAGAESAPSWSPDGTQIAFNHYDGTPFDPATGQLPVPGTLEIYVMNADGTNPTNITNTTFRDADPCWSPDGTQIAFTSFRGAGGLEIYVMNADGSNQTNITNNAAYDIDPSWSPDGTQIAFSSVRNGNSEIYVMDADGTNQTRLTNSGGDAVLHSIHNEDPSWSPDGTQIAFNYYSFEICPEIHVMNADGSNRTSVFVGCKFSNRDTSWSPDGTQIAFTFRKEGLARIYVMDADGTNQTRLTTNSDPADHEDPSWSPLLAP